MTEANSAHQTWLSRYRAGDREAVWHELRQLGAHLADEQRASAQSVCDEMAQRARQNVELLVENLRSEGYRFHSNDDDRADAEPFLPAGDGAQSQTQWLQDHFGNVPLTLVSWLRIVGDVWLVGTHPEWPGAAAADPLVIELEGSRYPEHPISRFFANEYATWKEWQTEADDDQILFNLPMSPDYLHKQNVSGGGPYGVILPDGCVDGLWRGNTTMPFVAYLNHVFGHGGFPGHDDSAEGWRVRTRLAAQMLPL